MRVSRFRVVAQRKKEGKPSKSGQLRGSAASRNSRGCAPKREGRGSPSHKRAHLHKYRWEGRGKRNPTHYSLQRRDTSEFQERKADRLSKLRSLLKREERKKGELHPALIQTQKYPYEWQDQTSKGRVPCSYLPHQRKKKRREGEGGGRAGGFCI